MARRKHKIVPGVIYHLTNQGHNRDNIFIEEKFFRIFLERFRHRLHADHAVLLAFVLMPNHFHLLVLVKSEDFAREFKNFLISYAKSFNNAHDRVGALCRSQYDARPVTTDAYMRLVSRYIHINPVKDGFVSEPEHWPYSSYGDYVSCFGSGHVDPMPVLALFGDPSTSAGLAECRLAYSAYVKEWRDDSD